MAKQQYLQKRGGMYHYRRRVPPELVPFFNGQKEITVALKTSDYRLACDLVRIEATKDDGRFAKIRSQQPKVINPLLTEKELHYMALEWFRQLEAKTAKSAIHFGLLAPDDDKEEALEIAQQDEVFYRDNEQAWPTFMRKAEELLKQYNFEPAGNKDKLDKLAVLIKQGYIEHAERMQERIRNTHPQVRLDSPYKDINHTTTAISYKQDKPLSDLIKTYVEDGTRQKLSKQMIRLRTTALNLFVEVIGGDMPIKEVTSDHCRKYYDVLGQLPARARKKLGKMTLKKKIEANKSLKLPTLSDKTKKNYIHALSAFFKVAVEENYITRNPIPSKLAASKKQRARELRDTFSIDQLNTIFHAPLYTGCKNDEFGYNKKGGMVIRRSRFWIPLLGLYTGMRLNELCQLFVDDIQNRNGVDVIVVQVDDKEEKRVKSLSGLRIVPIHPMLKKCGFMEYVASIRGKHIRLFPDIEANADGYFSGSYSKWFGRYLNAIGAKTDKTTFHSFRHTFRSALRTARVSVETIREVCGWSGGGGQEMDYGDAPPPMYLFDEVSRVNYEGLDLSHLYVRRRKAVTG